MKPHIQKEARNVFCLSESDSEAIFFASMIYRSGTRAHMRSSFDVQKGDALLIAPVPETERKQYTAEAVKSSRDKVEAHVNRVEGRGTYHVRLVSCNEQDILNRVRTGQIKEDYLKIEPMQAGLITTLRLTGGWESRQQPDFKNFARVWKGASAHFN